MPPNIPRYSIAFSCRSGFDPPFAMATRRSRAFGDWLWLRTNSARFFSFGDCWLLSIFSSMATAWSTLPLSIRPFSASSFSSSSFDSAALVTPTPLRISTASALASLSQRLVAYAFCSSWIVVSAASRWASLYCAYAFQYIDASARAPFSAMTWLKDSIALAHSPASSRDVPCR